jgi:outer membrane protein TolC
MLPLLALVAMVAAAPLTLPDVLAEVGAHAPVVEVAEAGVDVRRATVATAGTWDDTTFRVMADAIPLPGAGMDAANPTMISYRLAQPLNLFGRRGLARASVAAEVAQAEAQLRRSRWDARAQAVSLFYELWMNQAMAALLDEQLATLARMRADALARVEAGLDMGHHDVLRAESEQAVMTAEQAALADQRAAMSAMLNTLRGRPIDDEVGVVVLPAPAALPELAALADAAGGTPEVAAARAMQTAAVARAGLARKMTLPMVMIEGGYDQNLGGMPDGLAVGVAISLPLFTRERPRAEVAMATAMARAADREADAMRRMAGAELRMAWSEARAADRRIAALEQSAIPKLRETIASADAAYVAGSGSFLALVDTVMELKDLEARRIEAVAARGIARFALDRIAGAQLTP